MKTKLLPMSRLTQALLLAGLVAAAAPASAIEYWLQAQPLTIWMPSGASVQMPGDTESVPMWGYASCTDNTFSSCSAATVPGPPLTVPPLDPVLTVNLNNTLPAATSIVIPGQTATMIPVWDNGAIGARPPMPPGTPPARVRSFTHETPAGGTMAYTWSSMKAGTYLYHSGTHPQVQVQMGLYGAVTKNAVDAVTPNPAEAYPGVPYSNQVTLLYSEIDPALHTAVTTPGGYGPGTAMPSTLNYQPQYFLINGKPFQVGDPPRATLAVGQATLVRFLNAGLQTHVPMINGMYMQMIAEDGNPYQYQRQQYSALLPAAKTVDALITPTQTGTYSLFDRRLNLTNAAAQDGGMQATLEVGVAGPNAAPTITSTAIIAASVGQPYSYDVDATDPNAGDVLSYSLDAAPAGMTIDGATGLITWTPGAAGDFNVTVRATDSGGLFATQAFTITAVAPVLLYFSTNGNIAVPGVGGTADDADIYSWDGTSFARVLDATAAGLLAQANVDGIKVMGNQIYLSFSNDVGAAVPGVGTVQDEDIVVYDTSTSTWSMFLDGSDVGLTTGDEDVDGFDILADGSVLVSTFGPVAVPGVAGTWMDEDVLRCVGTFGSATTCTWSVYFDGSDVGLANGGNNEDVDGVSMGTGRLYLSTRGAYSVPALTALLSNATANAGGDVFSCDSPVIGTLSNCGGFSLYFRASDHGLSGNLDAFSVP